MSRLLVREIKLLGDVSEEDNFIVSNRLLEVGMWMSLA